VKICAPTPRLIKPEDALNIASPSNLMSDISQLERYKENDLDEFWDDFDAEDNSTGNLLS